MREEVAMILCSRGLGFRPGASADLTRLQASILCMVGQTAGCTQAEVRQELSLDAMTLSQSVWALRDGGMLTTLPLPEDRRIHVLSLTARGKRVFQTVLKEVKAATDTIAERLAASGVQVSASDFRKALAATCTPVA